MLKKCRPLRIRLNQPGTLLPWVVVGLAWLAAGCAAQPAVQAVELNVFAAASLTAAFEELGAQFGAANPGASVVFNFAGSQQLAQQISEGAPADVFASANQKQMGEVEEAGLVSAGSAQTFVQNRLVAIFPADNPADLSGLPDLAKPGVRLVLAAAEVPVGQYSLDFLDKASADPAFGAGFKEEALKNVVSYEDNVKVVLAKVALGEADAGIVYASDVTGEDANRVGILEIPDALNVIASYPIAALSESENADLAQAFVDFVLSAAGADILAEHGFLPVK